MLIEDQNFMGNCMELLLGLANLMVDISDNCSS